MTEKLELRLFNIREATWQSDHNVLSNLRRLVFIIEQKVPNEVEWDGLDDDASHWLATDANDRPIGTARLLSSGQIGRMAVLEEFRGLHIGAALLEKAVEKALQLGFTSVFLNAQAHALDFYKKSGFEPEGEEFLEAGIVHFRMTRKLNPPQTPTQKKVATGILPDVTSRNYDTAEVDWPGHGKVIRSLRRSVLVSELGLPNTMVEDEDDQSSIHFHSQSADGQTIGAIRLDLDGNISRLAVHQEFRNKGTGFALLEAAFGKAQRFGLTEIRLPALTSTDYFYRKAGYQPRGEISVDHELEYQEYFRHIDYEDVFQHEPSESEGNPYSQKDDTGYRLGTDDRFLLLRREGEFRRVIIEMCKQATQSIKILSPVLDHKLFDKEELKEICSVLARRNRYTSIEILLYDSHRVVKNGHVLLEVARKLSSSIGIKIVHPELRSSNHEFIVVDGTGVIYRQDSEIYEGYANFRDIAENNRLRRLFRSAWDSGLRDPNLRQLKI